MTTTFTKPFTFNKFLALPEIKPAREYIAGEVIQKQMLQGKHSLNRTQLITAISKPQAIIAFPELRCNFADRSIVPDLAIVKQENIPTIDPAEKSIFIYHSGKQVEVIEHIDQELLVPGFAASVKLTAGEIFSWLKLS